MNSSTHYIRVQSINALALYLHPSTSCWFVKALRGFQQLAILHTYYSSPNDHFYTVLTLWNATLRAQAMTPHPLTFYIYRTELTFSDFPVNSLSMSDAVKCHEKAPVNSG